MEKIEYAIEEQHSINGWYTDGWDEIGRTESKSIAESDVNRLNKRNGCHYRIREIHIHCERLRRDDGMKKIYLDGPVPLVEGEVPHAIYMEPDGRTYTIQYEQSDFDNYDPFGGREKDTETYFLSDKQEWYGYTTHCKHCWTEFMAWSNDKEVRNYCPGCGEKL